MRGVAVVLVVLFHLNAPYFDHGFLGVDAFFVISGFLMAILYQKGKVRDFYKCRASRLLPAYFATIILTLVISAYVTLPSEHSQVVEQGVFASVFLPNIGFWLQNSYFSKAEFNPLLHLWSLGVEIQFYLIVPLLAWLHRRSYRLSALLLLGSMAGAFLLVNVSPKTAFFMMPFRAWQFLLVAGVAWYLSSARGLPYSIPWLGMTALILLLGITIAYPVDGQLPDPIFGHPGLAALLITLATACVLAFGLPDSFERSIPGLILRKLGDWSYSIYLAHFPVIVLALYVPFSGTILTPLAGC
ncbi:MAG: acyltransferase [Sulfitobacter sp.]|uniref:acyltransferase family protein n=1 Tax=Roseibium sp. TaxID=1936156 RepID=UPI003264BC4B